jgi:hypothetical protein
MGRRFKQPLASAFAPGGRTPWPILTRTSISLRSVGGSGEAAVGCLLRWPPITPTALKPTLEEWVSSGRYESHSARRRPPRPVESSSRAAIIPQLGAAIDLRSLIASRARCRGPFLARHRYSLLIPPSDNSTRPSSSLHREMRTAAFAVLTLRDPSADLSPLANRVPDCATRWRAVASGHAVGASPSGKATDFDSVIRRFDPSRPSHPVPRWRGRGGPLRERTLLFHAIKAERRGPIPNGATRRWQPQRPASVQVRWRHPAGVPRQCVR